MGLLDVFDLTAVYQRVITFLGPVGKLINLGVTAIQHLATIVQRLTKLLDDGVAEFKAFKNFKEDIRFKSRVVNLELAFKKTRDLIEGIPAAWHSIVDIVKQFKEQLPVESGAGEAKAIAEELEDGSGEALTKLFQRFPKLLKGLQRVTLVLGLVLNALESISKVIDDLQTILSEITRLRLEIEKLDTIFLEQGNKRKRLKLANGRSIRIRLGKLHPAV